MDPRKIFAALALAIPVAAGASPDESALTIYSSQLPGAMAPDFYRPVPGAAVPAAGAVPGYAMVRQDRDVPIAAGHSSLRFSDVAGLIDPTTVTFVVPGDPAVRVLEQNFQFDLVSTPKLLLRYLDRPITVEQRNVGAATTTLSGTLLSAGEGLVLRSADGTVHALTDYSAVSFPELPGGLITRPTLVWELDATAAGSKRARVTYQTGGMTWWADYNVVYNEGRGPNDGLLDLSAWVSVINQSGASFQDARLKLVAGDVHRAARPEVMGVTALRMAEAAPAAPGFSEKAFDEFHLYTLGHPTTLPNNSTKQIELFDRARQIPARRLLVYDALGMPGMGRPYTARDPGFAASTKVQSYLEFRNDAASGLGVPLPAGRVRVSRLDSADGSIEFIGEDVIDHTPKDETVRLQLGNAFDVVGERRQVDFALDSHARWLEEEIEIRLRNHKSQPVEVQVREPLYRGGNWQLLSHSLEYHKDSAQLIHFNVTVPKDGETVVHYRVRYSW